MASGRRYTDPDGIFQVELPAGWQAEPNAEEGGVEIWHPEGFGVLHLIGFPQAADEATDPAEELYAFLDEQGIELEEDEVEDVELAGGAEMALCEFTAEDAEAADDVEEPEEEGGPVFWRVGVAAVAGALVFGSYSCPAGEEDREAAAVRAILGSIRPV